MLYRFFNWLLCKLLPYEDIQKDGSLYMRRFRLMGYHSRLPTLFGRNVMVHRIIRPDGDRDPHDHPWGFWSLILWGGYNEATWDPVELDHCLKEGRCLPDATYRFHRFLSFGFRPAMFTHQIVHLFRRECWTFVVTDGQNSRPWGFWTPAGWVHWKDYVGHKGVGTRPDKVYKLRTGG